MTKKETTAVASFKLPLDEKERFTKVAAANDVLPSQLLRGFVKQYLKDNAQGKLI